MKLRDFDKVINKLGMETRDTTHHHAWLVHEGVTVVRTKRSHGNRKFLPERLIRKQLHVDEKQFAGLHDCTISKDAYIAILVSKNIIQPGNKANEPQQPTAKDKTNH